MDVQTQTVAEAVAEILAVARVHDHLAGRAVDHLAGDTGAGGGDTGQLGLEYDGIDVFHLVGGAAHGNGTGHVGAIAVFQAAEVHGEEVALLNHLVPGHAVGQTGLGAGDHNGVKGVALAAVAEHTVDQLCCHFPLGHAGPDDLQRLFKGKLADALGLAHGFDFPGALCRAQIGEDILSGQERQAQTLFQPQIFAVAQLLLLRAQTGDLCLLQSGNEQGKAAVLLVEHLHGDAAVHAALRRFYVARIGEQPGLFAAHKHIAVGKGEAGGVALVLFVGDQDGVKLLLTQFFLNFCNTVHIPVSSDVGRGKLTMNREPCGLFCPTAMVPPWASTASCTILNPRPLPPASRERALSTR